jgi:hypothetical protein
MYRNIGRKIYKDICDSSYKNYECIQCGMTNLENPVVGRYGLECKNCVKFSFCHFCKNITYLQNLCSNCSPPVLLLQQWFRHLLYNPDNGVIFKNFKSQ